MGRCLPHRILLCPLNLVKLIVGPGGLHTVRSCPSCLSRVLVRWQQTIMAFHSGAKVLMYFRDTHLLHADLLTAGSLTTALCMLSLKPSSRLGSNLNCGDGKFSVSNDATGHTMHFCYAYMPGKAQYIQRYCRFQSLPMVLAILQLNQTDVCGRRTAAL